METTRTPAAFTGPILFLLLASFLLNAVTGIGLWLVKTHLWRVLHGWSIPPFLIVLGVVWRFHIVRGWRLKKNVLSGIVTLLIFIVLTGTGWTIYYSGSEEVQKFSAQLHTWLGIIISFVLFIHAILGWRTRDRVG